MRERIERGVVNGSTHYRLVIADDHPLFREALRGAVQRVIPGVQLLEADSVEALYALAEQHPDAAIFSTWLVEQAHRFK